MDKHTYYVSINQRSKIELFPEQTDSNLIQYEVSVNDKELEELNKVISRFEGKDIESEHIFARPFNESAADGDKQTLKRDTKALFNLIERYGTEDKKINLRSFENKHKD
ncbi:hypothetical protein [Alteribacter populi]|uniref:hypothetical protein n=1 Tax=Alteribacter populi TaxID=2011011 RepID=UPI000BBB0270|nr:hypothetical protein [Alteribacter populi]